MARLPPRSPGRSFCREKASPALKDSSSATLRVSRGLDSCDCLRKESHSPALTQRHTPGPALYPHPVTTSTHGVSCFPTNPPHCRPAAGPTTSPPLATREPSPRGAAPASRALPHAPAHRSSPHPDPAACPRTQLLVLFSAPPSPRAGPAIPGALASGRPAATALSVPPRLPTRAGPPPSWPQVPPGTRGPAEKSRGPRWSVGSGVPRPPARCVTSGRLSPAGCAAER